VVEHSELQSKRSNPNARRQLGDLKEALLILHKGAHLKQKKKNPPNRRKAHSGFFIIFERNVDGTILKVIRKRGQETYFPNMPKNSPATFFEAKTLQIFARGIFRHIRKIG
jgi:hypothetical protein